MELRSDAARDAAGLNVAAAFAPLPPALLFVSLLLPPHRVTSQPMRVVCIPRQRALRRDLHVWREATHDAPREKHVLHAA